MKSLNEKLELLVNHLKALDKTFSKKSNYSNVEDHKWFKSNYDRFESLAKDTSIKHANIKVSQDTSSKQVNVSFSDEIYHQDDRQMKLADIIEYLFFSRGVYFIFQSNHFKRDRIKLFLELILRYVNLLMVFENITVDSKLRGVYLDNLESITNDEIGYKELREWSKSVGLPSLPKDTPNEYFDSILPKTAGGLWHEMLVFAFILKYDIGYIFPLLLAQKPISLTHKLSPPDLVILHNKTYRFYGIEIGNLKERQTGGFSAPSGIPIIPIDTLNARISDRCPSCKKWIGICEKVIIDFCNTDEDMPEPINEIRCLVDCSQYTLEEKITGICPVMKFRSASESNINGTKFSFCDGKHHHYKCCLTTDPNILKSIREHNSFDDLTKLNELLYKTKSEEDETWISENYSKLKKKFNFIKSHSVFYSELTSLIKINKTIAENK